MEEPEDERIGSAMLEERTLKNSGGVSQVPHVQGKYRCSPRHFHYTSLHVAKWRGSYPPSMIACSRKVTLRDALAIVLRRAKRLSFSVDSSAH